MSRPEHDDLLQGEVDGVNSAAESARLKEMLAASPDLEARLGSLRRISETLCQAERYDPPPGFVDEVLSSVRPRRPIPRAQAGWREAVQALFSPAPLAACAGTLVVGIVLGGLLPPDALLFSKSERAALSGTALPAVRPGALDRKRIAADGVRGEVVARIQDGLVVVDLELDTTRSFDVRLDLDAAGLSPRGFSRDGASAGDVVLGSREVLFVHPAGLSRYRLSFAAGPSRGKVLRLQVGDGEGWGVSLGQK